MAINYNKYIESTDVHYIANSGSDERGKASGGKPGDQTGKEWQLKPWYNRPWSVVLRYPDSFVGMKIAKLGIAAALNPHIGYDQSQRKTYWYELEKVGYDPSLITTDCEEDCTAGVTANAKAAGYLLNIKKLKDLRIDTYSVNMRSRFVAAGFKALTDDKHLYSCDYLLPGDILLFEGRHAATNITFGKYAEKEVEENSKTVESPDICTGYVLVERGNYHVRKEASSKSESCGIVGIGDILPYISQAKDGWFMVIYNGNTGWISAKAGDIHLTKDLTVKPSNWYVRAEPNSASKDLVVVSGGETVSYLDKKNGNWLYVYAKGIVGWISKKAVTE